MKNQQLFSLRRADRRADDSQSEMLLVVGTVEDTGQEESVFDQFPWRTHHVRNCLETFLAVHCAIPRVIVCERDLPDGSWKDILEIADSMPVPAPLIVTSRLADDYLWVEVLNLGGYDVLGKPLDKQEVSRTVNLAWHHWASRRDSAQRDKTEPFGKGGSRICLTA
jgi:FixJ family two-component response regulator